MTDRDHFALLLIMLLAALLLARCGPDGADPPPTPIPGCGSLWMDCEDDALDREICANATDEQYAFIGDETWFSYVHCDTKVRTQLLYLPEGCRLAWK